MTNDPGQPPAGNRPMPPTDPHTTDDAERQGFTRFAPLLGAAALALIGAVLLFIFLR